MVTEGTVGKSNSAHDKLHWPHHCRNRKSGGRRSSCPGQWGYGRTQLVLVQQIAYFPFCCRWQKSALLILLGCGIEWRGTQAGSRYRSVVRGFGRGRFVTALRSGRAGLDSCLLVTRIGQLEVMTWGLRCKSNTPVFVTLWLSI